MKKILVFQAPLFTASGYGSHARDILKSLYELDVYDVKIIPTKWGMTPQDQLDTSTEFGQRMLRSVITSLNKKPEVYIQMSVPNEFRPLGSVNIGITAGTEGNLAPKEFIDGVNTMDLILVPSEFTKNVLQQTVYIKHNTHTNQQEGEHKTSTPIKVLFEGVDTSIFSSYNKNVNDPLKEVETDFNFLICGHWLRGVLGEDRKDIGMTLKTIATVFQYLPADKRPGIILKSSTGGYSIKSREEIRKRVDEVLYPLGDNIPSVYLLHGDLTDQEMSNLYHNKKVKAMVSFTKGEGYGRPLAEFAMTGKPIIVSKWSGLCDFLPDTNTVYLDGSLTQVHSSVVDKFIIEQSKWFTVNYTDAANKIHNVFKNYEQYRTKSANLPLHIRTKFSLKKMTEELGKILEEVDVTPNIVPLNLPELPKIDV